MRRGIRWATPACGIDRIYLDASPWTCVDWVASDGSVDDSRVVLPPSPLCLACADGDSTYTELMSRVLSAHFREKECHRNGSGNFVSLSVCFGIADASSTRTCANGSSCHRLGGNSVVRTTTG